MLSENFQTTSCTIRTRRKGRSSLVSYMTAHGSRS